MSTQIQKAANATPVKQKIDTLRTIMAADSVKQQFENVLKENSGAFVASIIDLYGSDNKLQECDPKAVVSEALKAVSLKLPINKSLGHAWIVAYKGVPQFQIGYKGLVQLAMRTGFYKYLNADVVYEGEFVSKNKLTGEFDLNGKATSNKVIGFFAYLQLTNGFEKTLYMTYDQVHAWGKKYSPSYGYASSPWKNEFDKMAIKTLLRNLLSHWGYLSIEMVTAMDNDADFKEPVEDKVKADIQANANAKELKFEDAQVIEEVKTTHAVPVSDGPAPSALEPNENPTDDSTTLAF